jgi:hypothetical protein
MTTEQDEGPGARNPQASTTNQQDGGHNNGPGATHQSDVPTTLETQALTYAAVRGWVVFPASIEGPIKKSHKSAEFSNGRPWGATNDAAEISRDFKRWPHAGIGVPTGPRSGIFVLEADTLKGHNVDGIARLQQLQAEHDSLPKTLMAESPSGSLHYYFKYPESMVIRNSESVLAPGIDVRGDGGMVIAPPTIRSDGRYKWLNDEPVADAPDWLLDLLAKQASEQDPMSFDAEDFPESDNASFVEYELAAISPDVPRRVWFAIGCAIYKECGPVAGFPIWDGWSSGGTKYNAREMRSQWNSIVKAKGYDYSIDTIHAAYDQANPVDDETSAMVEEFVKAIKAKVEQRRSNTGNANGSSNSRNENANAKKSSWRDHVYTAAALQHMTFPPVAFCVPGLIPEGLTMLTGKPKVGKSWMALDICIAKAAGLTCLGGRQPDQGDVLYAAMEDNRRRLQRRIKKLVSVLDIEWPQQLTLANSWRRLNEGGVNDIREWIEQTGNPTLVVLDTLAGVKPVGMRDSYSYAEDYKSLTELHRLANDKGISIIVLHHTRKMEAEDPIDTVSGTLGLTGCVDTVIVINRTSQGTTLYVTGRDIEEAEHAINFDKESCQWTILGDAHDVQRSESRKKILAVLAQATDTLGPQEIAASTGLTLNNVWQLMFQMTRDGEVVKVTRGKYLHPDHPKACPP